MAYINVDEVYILDNTGAQVDAVTDIPFKQDAGLTDAQKAQARANLGISESGGGGVNRNLLDNAWFIQASCVNQRSYTSSASTGEVDCVDRWKVNRATASVTLTGALSSQGLSLAWNGTTSSNGVLTQRVEKSKSNAYAGKTMTVSVLLADGTVYSGSFTWPASNPATVTFTSALSCTVWNNLEAYATLNIYNSSTTAVKIHAIKLELGSASTLANDTPPDYTEELRKCKWYFRRIKSSMAYAPVGYGFQTSSVVCNMKIAGAMRTAPTPTFSGTLRLVGNTSASIDVTSLTSGQTDTEGVVVKASTAGNLSANHAYVMYLTTNSYIDLSADL